MFVRAAVLWVLGLVTLVPYGAHYLLFEAPREQYALLITALLFWIFGYWGLVGPLVLALKARRVMACLKQAHPDDRVAQALHGAEARDVVVALIASEHRVPRFLAERVFRLVVDRMAAAAVSADRSPRTADGSPRIEARR